MLPLIQPAMLPSRALIAARPARHPIRGIPSSRQKRWMAAKPPTRQRPWAGGTSRDQQYIEENRATSNSTIHRSGQNLSPHQRNHQINQPGPNTLLSSTLQHSHESNLSVEVRIPYDSASILPIDHPAMSILGNSALVIQRQMEMMNILVGFEQANKYVIMNGTGDPIGYIAEQDHGIGNAMARQIFRTHRSFTTHIFDRSEKEVLRIHRPFAYINSKIRIYDPVPKESDTETESSTALQDTSIGSGINSNSTTQTSPLKLTQMRIIGETQQQWAPLRRKYNLFAYRPLTQSARQSELQPLQSDDTPDSKVTALAGASVPEQAIESSMVQFAHVNEPFLSWDFTLRDAETKIVGSVNRNFSGFAREIFTDTGVYVLRLDSVAEAPNRTVKEGVSNPATAMTLDQRAIMLATAVSIDFDYFSRHSHSGAGGFFPFPIWMGGSAPAEGAGAEGAIEGAGAAAGRGVGAGEGTIAGAGTMAGYEAMQRSAYGSRQSDDASPTSNEPFTGTDSNHANETQPKGDIWGESQDPWHDFTDKHNGRENSPSGGADSGGSGEGGGEGSWLDFFSD